MMLQVVAPIQETFNEGFVLTAEFPARGVAESDQTLQPGMGRRGGGCYRHGDDPSTSSSADRTIWLVPGMAVMRDLLITAVARQLDIASPAADGSRTVAGSATSQARARLTRSRLDRRPLLRVHRRRTCAGSPTSQARARLTRSRLDRRLLLRVHRR